MKNIQTMQEKIKQQYLEFLVKMRDLNDSQLKEALTVINNIKDTVPLNPQTNV